MLASPAPRPLKHGWVLKKGKTGFITHWRLKYLVLLASDENDARLQIFDQVDQSRPPKHEIWLRDASVAVWDGSGAKKGSAPFVVVDRKRKFYFAAQTKGERDDWLAILQPSIDAPLQTAKPTHHRRATITSRTFSPTSSPPLRRSNSAHRYRTWSRRGDEDTMSTWSGMDRDSDAVSVYSVMTSKGDERCNSVASSRVETLSFCSEPVLTPQELTLMGNSSNGTGSYRHEDGFTFRDTLRRRRAPVVHPDPFRTSQGGGSGELWNDRYQTLLSIRPDSDEAALRQDVQLQELIGQFQETAQQMAQRMIDEYHLTSNPAIKQRNQTPSLNGRPMSPSLTEINYDGEDGNQVKGSDVTVVQDGIVFRFACNYDDATPSQVEDALSRSSSELRAINASARASFMNSASPSHLHTVLMVLIDYKGFRVVAYADMGLQGRALQVHDLQRDPPRTDERASERLMAVGKALNLKPHTVQIGEERRVMVHMAAGVEVHFDPPSKLFYASNLHALLPMDHSPHNKIDPSPHRRLRPEFLAIYPHPLTSDAFTKQSGGPRHEREANDAEVMRASKFLQEIWIPSFVFRLDSLEVRPVDSRGLVGEMHCSGVNVRYLGHISRLSTLPYIRDMAHTEMVARAFKSLFRTRLRTAILHFRSVGATVIDEEMKTYAVGMFGVALGSGEKRKKFFEDKLRDEIVRKYGFDMSYGQFAGLPKPALFLAMQYHCGVALEDSTDYNFDSPNPIPRNRLLHFQLKIKQPAGLAHLLSSSQKVPEDERLAYHLARHIKSLGPSSKLARLDTSSAALCTVAAHYNATSRYEEARLYAQAAVSASTGNSCLAGLAMGQLIEAVCGVLFDETQMTSLYQQAVEIVTWACGVDHPVLMALHDRVAGVYAGNERWEDALEYYGKSLGIAEKALGKNHLVTAGYLVKIGIIHHTIQNPVIAIQRFTEALHLYQGLNAPLPLLAHLHHHFAQPLAERGDLDTAIMHAQRARKMYEKCLGQADPRTVETYRQVAKLVLTPYAEYEGVLTPVIRASYKEAIGCYEKVFRYVKGSRSGKESASMLLPLGTPLSNPANHPPSLPLLGTTSHPTPITGPLIQPHQIPLPTHPRSLLHKLTRQIISLKLRLVDSPQHREVVRTLRAANVDKSLDAQEARAVVLRLAAVSPSVYLDGVFARIEEEDASAVEELGVVLMLTEGEVVGLAG
ncbi:hypothetical protein SpCBS45565_g02959 [Spizellomyces sp. 'palustris']|nr:hypothetical protein SpCBS45565_g02959 [Spizellomyces sp. 'palustris']